MIRVLGFIVGLLMLVIAITNFWLMLKGEHVDRGILAGIPMGVVFIAYGIGGQALLSRIAPNLAENSKRPHKNSDSPVLPFDEPNVRIVGAITSSDVGQRIIVLNEKQLSIHLGDSVLWHLELSRVSSARFLPGRKIFGLFPCAGRLLVETKDGDSYSEKTNEFYIRDINRLVLTINSLTFQSSGPAGAVR